MKAFGIDLSMRGTGFCCIDSDTEEMAGFGLAIPEKDAVGVSLMDQVSVRIMSAMLRSKMKSGDVVAIEGLSFGSKSGSKDILAGNFWHLQWCIANKFPWLKVVIIPVMTWRSKVIPVVRQRELKASGEKDWQKAEVVRCLPSDAREKFEFLLADCKLPVKRVYDLADAYFIAKHALKMEEANAIKSEPKEVLSNSDSGTKRSGKKRGRKTAD